MRYLLLTLVVLVSFPALVAGQAKKDDKKPADPKPATKAPADTDPLKALGTSVDLPPVTSIGKWSTLAKTTIPDNLIVLFSLRGADKCLGSGKKVELKEAADGRSWQCLATLRDGAEPVELGVFRIEKGALQFAWSSGAQDFPGAGQLRNAAFEIAVGTGKKVVGLRRPIKAEPLAVSYDEPSFVMLDIPDAPPYSTIRIEIDMPSPEYNGRKVNWRLLGNGPALKGSNDRLWAESIRLSNFAVKLETVAGKNIKVTATPMFWVADREKPQRLSEKTLTAALNQLNAYQSQLTAARDQLSKTKNLNDALKAKRDAMGKQLSAVRKTATDLENLLGFVKSTKLGNIHLRVSHELEPGFIVPLLTTK
jgi:hypothetical protein